MVIERFQSKFNDISFWKMKFLHCTIANCVKHPRKYRVTHENKLKYISNDFHSHYREFQLELAPPPE
jgi:hypothetical protein